MSFRPRRAPEEAPLALRVGLTPEDWTEVGYFVLEADYIRAQEALNLDYQRLNPGSESPGIHTFIPAELSGGEEPPAPFWEEHLPHDGSDEEQQRWNTYVGTHEPNMQINLQALVPLHEKLSVLSNDPSFKLRISETHEKYALIERSASAYLEHNATIRELRELERRIRHGAKASGRAFTTDEQVYVDTTLRQEKMRIERLRDKLVPEDEDMCTWFIDEVKRLISLQRVDELREGLVVTDRIESIIDEVGPSLLRGEPLLLIGHTGSAKTALANYIAKKYLGQDPESFFGTGQAEVDIHVNAGHVDAIRALFEATTGQVWEDLDQNPEAVKLIMKATGDLMPRFELSSLIRAAEEGRPYIADIADNFMTARPEVLKAYGTILTLRPGMRYTAPQGDGRTVTIQPGFVFIATVNERGRDRATGNLSSDFRSRFANVVSIGYPDRDALPNAIPTENMILAKAAVTDAQGSILSTIDIDELTRFVNACRTSQDLHVGNYGNRALYQQEGYITASKMANREPALHDTVLSPRAMVGLLRKVADGTQSFDHVLQKYVESIRLESDRNLMGRILQNHGFLAPETEGD